MFMIQQIITEAWYILVEGAIYCVAVGMLFNVWIQFFLLEMKMLILSLRRIIERTELTHVRYVEQCLTCNMPLVGFNDTSLSTSPSLSSWNYSTAHWQRIWGTLPESEGSLDIES